MIFNFKLTYFSGYILKKLHALFRDCSVCRENLIAPSPNVFHALAERREYNTMRHLFYPTMTFTNIIDDIHVVVMRNLPQFCSNLSALHNKLYDMEFNLSCSVHGYIFKKALIDEVCKILIFSWCHKVNLLLQGKMKLRKNETDEIKIKAYAKYLWLPFNDYAGGVVGPDDIVYWKRRSFSIPSDRQFRIEGVHTRRFRTLRPAIRAQ